MDGWMYACMYECAYGIVWSRVYGMLWYGMVYMYVCSIHGNPGRLDAAQHPCRCQDPQDLSRTGMGSALCKVFSDGSASMKGRSKVLYDSMLCLMRRIKVDRTSGSLVIPLRPVFFCKVFLLSLKVEDQHWSKLATSLG